jgi:heme exporter protein A
VGGLPPLGIELRRVRRAFGAQVALARIDLDIPQGTYLALMGSNGAGKSTLLRVIAGLAAPSAGTVSIGGVDLRRSGPGLRALVGFVSHESMLYADLPVRENLLFHARLFDLADPAATVEETAEQLDVTSFLDRPVRTLSRGMRQRATIARALLHGPRVLLLDEPYTGLDEAASASLAMLLAGLHGPDRTVIVATHELARALSGPERLIVLQRGKVVLDRPVVPGAVDSGDLAGEYLSLLRPTAGAR